MVEKLLEGPKTYYLWLLFLLCLIEAAALCIWISSRTVFP